ncbi:hypothetical protein Cadr_000028100 [Camelus dromedarius]|uniref:Uncharacterized protein n=1 Tax=Camelus dromedarius TaxID=9838 RepID=A0A5N4C9V5_CAMDR|nr:hypothetical protein Cadr_000028100 [Camelus dromedarius]
MPNALLTTNDAVPSADISEKEELLPVQQVSNPSVSAMCQALDDTLVIQKYTRHTPYVQESLVGEMDKE